MVLAEEDRQDRERHWRTLTWLSLVGLLPSRARLRFTRHAQVYQDSLADDGIHGCPIIGYGWCYQASSSRRHRQPCN
jgi:hypothetical protein